MYILLELLYSGESKHCVAVDESRLFSSVSSLLKKPLNWLIVTLFLKSRLFHSTNCVINNIHPKHYAVIAVLKPFKYRLSWILLLIHKRCVTLSFLVFRLKSGFRTDE